MTSAMSSSTANKYQIVQITSVDPTTNTAVGVTRQGQQLTINTQYLVGAIHYTPGVGEQWYIQQVGTVTWALERKLPKNTNDLLNVADNPVPGQVSIGSSGIVSGPLNLQGSNINAMAPLGLASAASGSLPSAVAAGAGALIWNTTTSQVMFSDGTNWYAVGTGGGSGGPVTWSDIEDIPTTFPSDWSTLGDIPTDFPTTWGDVTGKPSTYPPTLPTGTPNGTKFWRDDDTWAEPPSGGGGDVQLSVDNTPSGTLNGTNTVFTLPAFTLGTTMVYVNGVRQKLGADYVETNDTTLTFAAAPHSLDTLTADFVVAGNALVVSEIPSGALNGTNTTFTTTHDFAVSSTAVFLNGLRERLSVDYTESGSNEIIFAAPPANTDSVLIDYLVTA